MIRKSVMFVLCAMFAACGGKGSTVLNNPGDNEDVPPSNSLSVSLTFRDMTSIGNTMIVDAKGPKGICSFEQYWSDPIGPSGWANMGPKIDCGDSEIVTYRFSRQFQESTTNVIRVTYTVGSLKATDIQAFTTPEHEIELSTAGQDSVDMLGNAWLNWSSRESFKVVSTACYLVGQTDAQSEEFLDQSGKTSNTVHFTGLFPGRTYECQSLGTVSIDQLTGEAVLKSSPVITIQVPVQPASCPTLVPGDMFKISSPFPSMAYIVNHDNRAMYFPPDSADGTITTTSAVYASWRDSEQGLQLITQACFDAMPVPNAAPFGVNIRPGAFVVKRPSADQLYVILPGNTRAKITAAAAAALYAPAYADGVTDQPMVVPDIFWPNLVNAGPDIVELRVHPGMVFVVSDGETVYYSDSNGSIREVTTTGFTANHLQKRFVRRVPLSAVQGLPLGEPIDQLVPEINDPAQGI